MHFLHDMGGIMKKGMILLLAICSVFFAACDRQQKQEKDTLTVVTSFYPIYLLAQEVTEGAEGITLENMAQPQTGCLHDYELTVSDMRLLERADVLLINGGGMESFLSQAMEQYPKLSIVDTSAGISLLAEEGHEEEHAREEGNAHIWLSPERAAKQAENIAAALADLDESEATLFAENAADFRAETDELLEEAERAALPQGMAAAVFHEGFPYFAELFRIETVLGIFTDEYQIPSARELAEATEEIKAHEIRFFLAPAGDSYAELLAQEAGERVIILDTLTDEAEGSYTERMRRNFAAIVQYWKEVAA